MRGGVDGDGCEGDGDGIQIGRKMRKGNKIYGDKGYKIIGI
jgi:hypothetical protein